MRPEYSAHPDLKEVPSFTLFVIYIALKQTDREECGGHGFTLFVIYIALKRLTS
jgi:hypothetical protein